MAIDSDRSTTDHRNSPSDVETARVLGPAEADALLRECIALTHQRLDAALAAILDDLLDTAPASAYAKSAYEVDIERARAVRRERARFVPRFNAEFDKTFAQRRAGQPRRREGRTSTSVELALVDEGDFSEQVALKGAVNAMRAATQVDSFGFDVRMRLVMREEPGESAYENPWNADYICDALGNTCRALWPESNDWRPIMEHMVRELTAPVTALHRELNALLQTRGVLPVLHVRSRRRGGARKMPELDGSALFGKLIEQFQLQAGAQPSPSFPAPEGASAAVEGGSPLDFGNAAAWRPGAPGSPTPPQAQPWSAVLDAMNLLQDGQPSAAGPSDITDSSAAALRDGTGNAIPALKDALLAGRAESRLDHLTIDIIAALLDEVFDDPYLPAEIKTVFGRLQIAILKATLLDPQVLADPDHRVRQFFETLAAASVGLRPDDAHDVLFIELANRVAARIRDQFADDLGIFATARDELAIFLDGERAGYNQKLAEALPPLLARDAYVVAEKEARDVLAGRLARGPVPAELRAFLDHECVERMAAAHVDGGPEGAAWTRELQLIDDLLWSIAPEPGPGARKRLMQLVPQLVRTISQGWATDAAAQARRKDLLAKLYALHIIAMKVAADAALAGSDVAPATATAASSEAAKPAFDDEDEQVAALMRGDWCAFRGEDNATPVLAKLEWRAPHDTSLLFTYRDGTTAFIQSPLTLAEAFRNGRAIIAVEAVPLFERAMARLIEERSPAPAGTA